MVVCLGITLSCCRMSRRRDCPPTRKGRSHRCASVPRCSSSRLGSLRPCSASTPTGRKPAGSRRKPVTNRGGRRRRGLPLSTPGDRSGTRNPAQTAPLRRCHNRRQASRRERDTSGMTADRHHEQGWDIAHRVGVPHAPPSVVHHPAHRVANRLSPRTRGLQPRVRRGAGTRANALRRRVKDLGTKNPA